VSSAVLNIFTSIRRQRIFKKCILVVNQVIYSNNFFQSKIIIMSRSVVNKILREEDAP
jgi:hypothetical protein